MDGYQWVDSAVRKTKGRWERQFVERLQEAGIECKKRKFEFEGEKYEIDIACPAKGPIELAVDVKMIGHPSDKQKRGDEKVNKATKYKKLYPKGCFISLVYYPFDEDRAQLERRLKSGESGIDKVLFAGDDEESINAAVQAIQHVWRHF